MQQFSRPSTGLSGVLLPLELDIPEGPEYEKNQNYIDVRGEVLPTPRGTTTVVVTSKQSGKNGSFINRENHQHKKTADSVS